MPVMSSQTPSTSRGTAARIARDSGARSVAGRSRTATIGNTRATAAPVPKLWLATSMATAANTATRGVSGDSFPGGGTTIASAASTATAASAWPEAEYHPSVPWLAGVTANKTPARQATRPFPVSRPCHHPDQEARHHVRRQHDREVAPGLHAEHREAPVEHEIPHEEHVPSVGRGQQVARADGGELE